MHCEVFCIVHSLRFPFFFALLLSKDRMLPNTPKSLWKMYAVIWAYLCASSHLAVSSIFVPTLAVSSCLLCTHFYPISHSVLTPSFFTANFSSEYNRALGSIISKPIPPNPNQLHSETRPPPPSLLHLAFYLHL